MPVTFVSHLQAQLHWMRLVQSVQCCKYMVLDIVVTLLLVEISFNLVLLLKFTI